MDWGDSKSHDRGGGRGRRGYNRGRYRATQNHYYSDAGYYGSGGYYEEGSWQKDGHSGHYGYYQGYDQYGDEEGYRPRGRGRGGRRAGRRGKPQTSRGGYRGEEQKEERKERAQTSYEKSRPTKEYQRRENVQRSEREVEQEIEEAKIYYNAEDFVMKHDKLPEKTEYLVRELWGATISCAIWHNEIAQISAIWNCRQCYQPLHLGCIRRWIKKVNAELPQTEALPFENRKEEIDENENDFIEGRMDVKMNKFGEVQIEQASCYSWTCPHCSYNYTESMPKYYCYCRKEMNPDSSPYYLPHSCSKVCNKKKNHLCMHATCNLECHPGAWVPWEEIVTISCHCGKATREVFCQTRAQKLTFCCQDICGKSLECFNHIWEEVCHEGTCQPCKEKETLLCYWEKKEIQVEWGSSGASCHGICGKPLSWGNHTCPKTCHFGDCGDWEFLPEKVKFCPCGKARLKAMGAQELRKSWLDNIPTCRAICGKLLPCGTHHWRQRWHQGPWSIWEVQCTEKCVWGKGERKKKWYELNYPIDNIILFGEKIWQSVIQLREKPFKWIKKCNKIKRWKRHRCQAFWCPVVSLSDPSGAHICIETCGKDLPWGKHKCTAFCHTEQWEPCAVVSNIPLSCPWGMTVINPPVRWGERPYWFKKWRRIHKAWNHICGQQCHPGECPPWTEGVSKKCSCGKSLLENIKWGDLNPSCGQICNEKMPCGHRCKKMCHNHEAFMESGEIADGCGQKCNKPRKNCEHKCQEKCHSSNECPDLPCDAEIKKFCTCGFRFIYSICNRYDEGFEENEEEKTIECNTECLKNKRDAQIAKAFSSKDEKKQKELRADYYPEKLIEFAKDNLKTVVRLEKVFEEIIRTKGSLSLPDLDPSVRRYVSILAKEHYYLDICSYGGRHGQKAITDVYYKDENSLAPATLLSEYVKLINRGIVSESAEERKGKLFESTLKITELPIGTSLDDLKRNLIGFHSEFYTEKIGTRGGYYFHFYNKYRAEEAFKKLRLCGGGFSYIDLIDHTNPSSKVKAKGKKKKKKEMDLEGFQEV